MKGKKKVKVKNKKFLVVGFTERTGYTVSKMILERGGRVLASDTVENESKISLAKDLKNFYPDSFSIKFGIQRDDLLEGIDCVILSPGVPRTVEVVREAMNRGIEVIGDIELFYRLHPELVYVGITGTDGKSTTASLVYHILKSAGKKVHLAGNIGFPVSSIDGVVEDGDIVVLELSSFQIESIVDFEPFVGVLLNLSEDHLDRYDTVEDYWEAKAELFKNQNENDFAVLRKDDRVLKTVNTKAKILTFSATDPADAMVVDDVAIVFGKELIKTSEVPLIGIHNVENVLASAITCRVLGVDAEVIENAVKTFKGLPHRMEFVEEVDGVKFINDSKATTVNSLSKALISLNYPVVLIMGGRDKELDFSILKELVNGKVSHLILIGEAKEKIKRTIGFKGKIFECETLEEAVKSAFDKAKLVNGTVLFSPACASFDMFRNYEERGEVFKSIVRRLKNSLPSESNH